MEFYSARKRNKFESALVRWMNLEPVIPSEVSQKEKNKYWGFPWWSSDEDSVLPMQGVLDSVPGRGTRSHMSQLKILHAATKTQCNK